MRRRCIVTGISDASVSYAVILPVANPGILSGPRDEFLSRFWYVAQRHGLRLGAPELTETATTPDARLRMLRTAGAFHGDADALAVLAQTCAYRQYRRADVVLLAGSVSAEAFLVLTGSLSVSVLGRESEVRLELVGPGQLLVVQEMLTGGASPVQVLACDEVDLLAIPAATLQDVMERNRAIARDVGALAEARRLAIQPLARGLRAVA